MYQFTQRRIRKHGCEVGSIWLIGEHAKGTADKNPRGMVITAGQGDGRLIMKGEGSAEESVS